MRVDNSNQIASSTTKIASGKRINSASDDPTGLSVSQKLKSEINGLETGAKNAQAFNDVVKTASSALSSTSNELQRIRELSVQASNGTLSKDDKKMIQEEIKQLKSSIDDTAQNTEFNSQKLLDGSFNNKNVAYTPSGNGPKVSIDKAHTASLGISDFDVTKDADTSKIDAAISKVSSSQAKLGATSNSLEHATTRNEVAAENLASANSRVEDLDVAAEMIKLNSQKIVQQYQYYAQKETAQTKGNFSMLL